MGIEFDENKSLKNRQDPSRGFGLDLAAQFEWGASVSFLDTRKDYGEMRRISIGPIHGRLHVMVWTRRDREVRIISLRKANKREVRFYETQRQ